MKRSGFQVMKKLIGLVRPLSGYMILAVTMGLVGHLCATFITVFGGFAIVAVLKGAATAAMFGTVAVFALVRGGLRYAEQACNHFIAFKLLALIRDKVFGALRRLCPAKLEGKDKGDLISVITSDIELLEVFYAHTISPICIAFLFTVVMVCFIGSYHPALGLLALRPMAQWESSSPCLPQSSAATVPCISVPSPASSLPMCWTACGACPKPSSTVRGRHGWMQ